MQRDGTVLLTSSRAVFDITFYREASGRALRAQLVEAPSVGDQFEEAVPIANGEPFERQPGQVGRSVIEQACCVMVRIVRQAVFPNTR